MALLWLDGWIIYRLKCPMLVSGGGVVADILTTMGPWFSTSLGLPLNTNLHVMFSCVQDFAAVEEPLRHIVETFRLL